MKIQLYLFILILFSVSLVFSQTTSNQKITELPLWNQIAVKEKDKDWLVHPFLTKAGVYKSADNLE